MARKPNSHLRSTQRKEDNIFDEHAFVNGVFNDEYVLVIGSGVILNKEKFPTTNGDVNQYIIDEINNDRGEFSKNFTDISENTKRNEIDPIYKLLTEEDNDGNDIFDLEDISTELVGLLRTKLFRYVFTTTIDGYLEKLLRDIWGDDLRVVSIYDEAVTMKDFRKALGGQRVNKYIQPTLFYVFGHVEKGKARLREFVETDVDAIRVIEKWMNLGNSKDPIVSFLKTKRMLSLGCKFDDWYYRFFWYIITRGFGTDGRDGNQHTQDTLASISVEKNLQDYFGRMDVFMHEDVWSFMRRIHTLLTSIEESNPFRNMILAKRREGGIFISYKSSNVVAASKLFCKLSQENGLNVWFDNTSLDGGSKYASEIHTAINHARIFIPILSKEIEEDIINDEVLDKFYYQEWLWAKENKDIIIIPIAIEGYNLRGKPHTIFEKAIGMVEFDSKSSGIDMDYKPKVAETNEKIGYTKLLYSINKHLGLQE